MALTTKEASYIIVLGIVIFVLQISSTIHKAIIFSNPQNLTHFKSSVLLNHHQARWAEKPKQFKFHLFYQKGSSNAKMDI